ncbi:MAG: DUF2235 domain-containing protein [Bacteroidota bacterium]
MGKNIVIFSDGTNQKGGVNYNTNVYKLFNMVEDRTQDQVVFYDPGIGTDWRHVAGAVSGWGFKDNVLDCYRFLFENYESEDHVYLFGFSRGAATVRSLSGFIHLFGILPKSRADLIEQAFDIYTINNKEKRERLAREFINKHHTMWCKIRFLGVWDTVAALGSPIKPLNFLTETLNLPFRFIRIALDRLFPHRFYSFGLSDSVEFARHALSIDEERHLFSPVIWDRLQEDSTGRMKQVWFCGVHTDVGGGYKEEELSNISLQWMVREAEEKGLRLYENAPMTRYFRALGEPKVDGYMHNELKFYFKRQVRKWNPKTHGPVSIHHTVLKRVKNNQNTDQPAYAPWILEHKERHEEM